MLVTLVALTVATRAPEALDEALWADEVYSARTIVAPSADEALHRIRLESSPPAYFLLGRMTHGLGASVGSVRMWSVLFSAVLTGLVVAYARRFLPLHGAALAGLLAALGYQLAFHGKELRPYAALAMLAVVFPFVLEAAVARPTLRRLAAVGLVVVAGSLTHYFFLLPLFVGILWLWTLSGARAARRRITLAVGFGLVPLLAWLPVMLDQAERVNSWFPRFRRGRLFELYSDFFASDSVWDSAGDVGRLAVVLVVLAGTTVLARRPGGALPALLVVVPVALTAAVSLLGLHVFTTRNLIVVAPFAAIAVAALASLIPIRSLAAVATVAVAVAAVWMYSVDSERGRTAYDDIGTALAELGWDGRDPLLFFGNDTNHRAALGWHLPGHPQLARAEAGSSRCAEVYAVVQRRSARRWLTEHADAVVARRRFPWFRIEGQPVQYDLVIARLNYSPGLLETARQPHPYSAVIFHSRTHDPPPCVTPLPPEREPRSLF